MEQLKIICLPLGAMRTNCYLVFDPATREGCVIDPGGETPEQGSDKILARLDTECIRLKFILLTHAHFDHMLSLSCLREATGAPLAIYQYDADALADPNLTYMAQFAGIRTPEKPAEQLLSHGDRLMLGAHTLEVLHTPGHTAGSVTLKGDGFLITGDTLFRGSVGRCDLFGGDEMALLQSLKQLRELDGDYKIFAGHGSTTTLSRERECNVYMR